MGALQAYTPEGPARSLKATHHQILPACMRLLTVEGGRVALTADGFQEVATHRGTTSFGSARDQFIELTR